MASAQSYPNSTPVLSTDRFLGTDSNTTTKNFLASDVSAFINPKEIITTTLTSYTLQLSTENNTLVYNGVGAQALTIDTNANLAFTIGCDVLICNGSASSITVSGAVGVTLNGVGTITTGESKRLKKTDTDVWYIY